MRKWTNSAPHLRLVIVVFDAFSNHCLANTIEPLRAANQFAGAAAYDWVLASVTGGPVKTSSGLTLETEPLRFAQGDVLVVMPSYDIGGHANFANVRAVRAAAKRFDLVVGLDTGAWLLAEAGLLDGKTTTIHWDVIDEFAEAFPHLTVVRDRYVADGRVVTCGGAARAFDWVTDMIGQRQGQAVKLQVTGLFHGTQAKLKVPRKLDCMVALMRDTIEAPLSLAEVSMRLGVHPKTLERQCKAELGTTPAKLYQYLRLSHAKQLLETTEISVAEAAVRSGYADPTALTRAFRQVFGERPRDVKL